MCGRNGTGQKPENKEKDMSPATLLQRLRGRIPAWLGVPLILTALLAGCGGSGDSSSSGSDQGQVVIGLTDAEGDFLSYRVDVLSLTLTRADGAVVETLPVRTTVDFAQYTELTEFLTAASVPRGIYTSATMRLDYSTASVYVEKNGLPVQALLQDMNGQPLTGMVEVTVQFDNHRALPVAPGIPAHLTLDFNLAVSNHVDTSGATPLVMVEPFLIADIEPDAPKIHRVRGPLKDVDIAASSFEVYIRPFHALTGNFGTLTVKADSATVYEINGTNYSGDAGLTALSLQPAFTAVVALGNLNVAERRFEATEVYAGSSVPFGTSDVLTGNVVARSGDQLTVRGASLQRQNGSITFHDLVTVAVGPNTRVTQQAIANPNTLGKDSLSVGQRIMAFGALDTGTSTLDATDPARGPVRMLVTSLSGNATVTNGNLAVAVQHISGRPISAYNFAGTSGTPADDADPAAYEIDTGTLSLSGLDGVPVRVRGHVRPFGSAPKDFQAISVVNLRTQTADLLVGWNPATAVPFASNTADGLALDLTASPTLHHLWRGGVATDLTTFGSAPMVKGTTTGGRIFAIGYQGTVQVYTDFDTYRQELATRLTNGQKARVLGGRGSFDETTATLTARGVFTALQP
jgi:hypothetical protein